VGAVLLNPWRNSNDTRGKLNGSRAHGGKQECRRKATEDAAKGMASPTISATNSSTER